MKQNSFLTLTILFIFIFGTGNYSATAADTYYVKPLAQGGNDNANGLSDATAWATITKVNKTVSQQSADVYFKCGGTWTKEHLTVDWSGTEGDRVIIGAYYGSGTIGVSGAKPIIDGNHLAPANQYIGLVHVPGSDYVTVKNLTIINSYGQGIRYMSGATYGIVDNVTVNYTGNAGIQFYGDGTDNGLIKNSTITLAGMGHTIAGGVWNDWPYGVGATAFVDNLTVRGCTVYNIYGEGIGFYRGSDNCTAENNYVYNARQWGIYLGAAQNCIVRYNLVYGTTDSDFHRSNGAAGAGMGLADEGWVEARTKNNDFYGNMVAFCGTGMHIGVSLTGAVFADSNVINNTFVGCNKMVVISGKNFSNSSIKNNIFWLAGGEKLYEGPSETPGLLWDHNNWSQTISDNQSGKNDMIGNPLLKKTIGWRSITSGNLAVSDFSLQDNSPNINNGVNLGDNYDDLLDANSSKFPTSIVTQDQDNNGTGWEIGAILFLENEKDITPSPPANLKISVN